MSVPTQIVRQVSPIPPGRYWITIQGKGQIADFDRWLREMQGAAVVQNSELDQSGSRPVAFVVFEVPPGRMPFLNAEEFGFPNTAPAGVTSRQDVEQSPIIQTDPLQIVQHIADDAIDDAKKVGLALLFLALVAGRH